MMRTGLTLFCLSAASPALALDTCLVGTWAIDAPALAGALGGQMGATARHVEGGATMRVSADGNLSMQIESLTFAVTMPNMPEMAVAISGHSTGSIETTGDGRFEATASDYSLIGSADVMGQKMEIPVTTASGGWGTATGAYQCADDRLAFDPAQDGSMPPNWQRID